MAKAQPKKPPTDRIDREKLRAAIGLLEQERVLHMLDDAISLLPATKLRQLAGRHLTVKQLTQLKPDAPGSKSLLNDVRAFEAASRAGEYYESFNVNSHNFMEKSRGTRAFIADCNRLLARCVARAQKGGAGPQEALETMLALLRDIDQGEDDIIFFADEAGLWQVGVDWEAVLPALFSCLSPTTEPAEYARRVADVIELDSFNAKKHLAAARRLGTAAQRKALRSAKASRRVTP